MSDNRPTIYAVDFDGTIVENDFPGIGKLNKGVRDYVVDRHNNGHIIILWTTRQNEKLDEALEFCEKEGIPLDYVNRNVPWLEFDTSDKIFADVYVDDRSYNPFENDLDDRLQLSQPPSNPPERREE